MRKSDRLHAQLYDVSYKDLKMKAGLLSKQQLMGALPVDYVKRLICTKWCLGSMNHLEQSTADSTIVIDLKFC